MSNRQFLLPALLILFFAAKTARAQENTPERSLRLGMSVLSYFHFDNQELVSENFNQAGVKRSLLLPALFLSYNRQVNPRFNLQLSGSYNLIKGTLDDSVSSTPFHSHHTVLGFSFSYHYIRTPHVSLYSGAGFMVHYRNLQTNAPSALSKEQFGILPDLCLIGLRAGKKWFVFAEAGAGAKGFFHGGIGFRIGKNLPSNK